MMSKPITVAGRQVHILKPDDNIQEELDRFGGRLVSVAIVENGSIPDPVKNEKDLKRILQSAGNISIFGNNSEVLEDYFDELLSRQETKDTITTTSEDSLETLLEWSILYAQPSRTETEYDSCLVVLFPGEIMLSDVEDAIEKIAHEKK